MAEEQVQETEVKTTPETATPGGAEPPVETPETPSATEKPSSEATVPKYRLDEVISQRNQERADKARLMALLEQRQQPAQSPQADPDPKPKQEDFAEYEAYLDARAAWTGRTEALKTIAQERQRDAQQQTARTEGEKINQAWQNYKTKTASEGEDFHESARSMPLGNELWIAVAKSENPATIIKHLQANPAELARITALPVMDRLIEYGRMESKLAGPNGQPQVSQMPKPMKPVGSGKSGSGEYTQDKVTATLYPR